MSIAAATPPRRTDWSAARRAMNSHYLRDQEIPLEHYVSLPIPTVRNGWPGFRFFACAVTRKPGTPPDPEPASRIWVLAAEGGALLAFERIKGRLLASASPDALPQTPAAGEVVDVRQLLEALEPILDQAATAFFDGQPAQHGVALSAAFCRAVGPAYVPNYRAVGADFFAWLEGGSGCGQGSTT